MTPRMISMMMAAALVCLPASAAPDWEPPSSEPNGFFLSLSGQEFSLQGDLSGDLTLWHFEKAFFVPKLSQDFGLAVGLGIRRRSGLWEFNVSRSSHQALWGGTESQASLLVLEVNGWGFPWKNSVLQAYYLLGLCFPLLTVQNGARMAGSVYDATYTGLGINLGAGLVLNLGRRVFISGGIKHRFLGFFYVNGGGKGRDIADLTVGHQGAEWDKWLRAPSTGLFFGLGIVI